MIFILSSQAHRANNLKQILESRVTDVSVTADKRDGPLLLQEEIAPSSEAGEVGLLYRRLIEKLERQVRRAEFLSEMTHLFSSSLQVQETLDRMVSKSTEILGNTSFIVLIGEEVGAKLEASLAADRGSLVTMLKPVITVSPQCIAIEVVADVLTRGEPVLTGDLDRAALPDQVQASVQQFSLKSILAAPIRTKDRVLGVFVSMSTAPRVLGDEELTLATELSNFTAIALENARLIAELQRSASTDPLTGLYNTRFFNEVLAREAARAERYDTPLSLLMIDVDGFKMVNDTHGHLVGNKVLTRIGEVLQESVRTADFVFRCGGDEFGVVLPETSLDGAVHAAEKILQKVEAAEVLPEAGCPENITVSIGISEYRRGSHFETLVAEADQALYASKNSSKNCATVFRGPTRKA